MVSYVEINVRIIKHNSVLKIFWSIIVDTFMEKIFCTPVRSRMKIFETRTLDGFRNHFQWRCKNLQKTIILSRGEENIHAANTGKMIINKIDTWKENYFYYTQRHDP